MNQFVYFYGGILLNNFFIVLWNWVLCPVVSVTDKPSDIIFNIRELAPSDWATFENLGIRYLSRIKNYGNRKVRNLLMLILVWLPQKIPIKYL